MLAAIDYHNPLLWAVLVGWIISVVLHEFAHGLIGHLGGDYTLRERGGLSLNPLQYVDPVTSLILPGVFLLMGGLPLPGGATYIRHDLLRSKGWESAVSAAGPLTNLILFLACALPLHPAFGWIDPETRAAQWTHFQVFLGAMAVLQLVGAVLNLVPVPPLDGFGIIAPHINEELRAKLSTPPLSTYLFLGFFLVLWKAPGVWVGLWAIVEHALRLLGFGDHWIIFPDAFGYAIWGRGG